MKISVIKIDSLKIQEHHLEIIYSADKFKFSTKIFYHDVSFARLIKKYYQPIIQRIVSHIALFEGMKLCSLFPEYYDISVIAEYLDLPALDMFAEEILSDTRIDSDKIEQKYNYVYATEHRTRYT